MQLGGLSTAKVCALEAGENHFDIQKWNNERRPPPELNDKNLKSVSLEVLITFDFARFVWTLQAVRGRSCLESDLISAAFLIPLLARRLSRFRFSITVRIRVTFHTFLKKISTFSEEIAMENGRFQASWPASRVRVRAAAGRASQAE